MEYLKDHVLSLMRKSAYRPMTLRELARRFDVPAGDRRRFGALIRGLCESGEVVRVSGRRYGLAVKMNLVTGVLQAHPDGYGFVTPEAVEGGPSEDVFVRARNMGAAMNGDRVLVRLEQTRREGRLPDGTVIRILKRAHTAVVGTLERFSGYGYVTPADRRLTQDVYIPLRRLGEAQTGDVVSARIVHYPARNRNPEGEIVEVLGRDGDPGVAEEVIIHKFELPHRFPKKVLQEAAAAARRDPGSETAGRLDLRERLTFTIDGENARDFDDAVSIERSPKSTCRLWVHIADVSHYVSPGGALDGEAYERGTSVYFPGRVLPMLPEAISNGICSLNPDEDRLAMTVYMEFSRQGKLLRHDFFETIIRSRARLTYAQVARALDGEGAAALPPLPDLLPALELARELAGRIRALKRRRGSIDFDVPEAKILMDRRGNITEIVKAERNVAHYLIEDFMIAANETVASYFHWLKVPGLYRVHEAPDRDRIAEFAEFAAGFGHRLAVPRTITPRLLSDFLASIEGVPEERVLSQVLLRSMKQARYAMENTGHFGLASDTYTHFTSPIRRYPDLVVHRLLRELLRRGRFSPEREEEVARTLPGTAAHASARERVALETEREVLDLKKAEFMADKVGGEFDGFVTAVTPFGFFVELREFMVEGLVHVSSLGDDYYQHRPAEHALVGEHTKKAFRLGDQVTVKVTGVSREAGQVDFSLVRETAAPAAGKPQRRAAKGKGRRKRPRKN